MARVDLALASGADIIRLDSIGCGTILVDESFRKDLGWLGILAAGFNLCNSWLVVAVTLTISIGYGPSVSAWGIVIVTAAATCISITLAELVSVYPTTGGQYHWTSIMAPKSVTYLMVGKVNVQQRHYGILN